VKGTTVTLFLLKFLPQLPIDERDAAHLSSKKGIEDKSLAIPAKVQESLLSNSCDPKDVVLQLREELQVELDSLEHPEPKTKRLIRSLARKAKHSNRLDVVRYLRSVTPAGTTGESDSDLFEII